MTTGRRDPSAPAGQQISRNYEKGVPFEVGPYIRFQGEVGEQGTFFVREPGGNTALEFKTFRNFDQLFAK